jgi:hypothetical protein
MTPTLFLRLVAAATLSLTDEERDGLANCIDREIQLVMRVRRLKAEKTETLPPPRSEAVTMTGEEG